MDFPRKEIVKSLDADMSRVLKRPDMSVRAKMVTHNRRLGELLRHRQLPNVPPTKPPGKQSLPPQQPQPQQQHQQELPERAERAEPLTNVFAGIPKRLLPRAERLGSVLAGDPNVSVGDSGELYLSGEKIEGSNIGALIHDAVRSVPSKVDPPPTGRSALQEYFALTGLPKSYIRNREWKGPSKQTLGDADVVAASPSGTSKPFLPKPRARTTKNTKSYPSHAIPWKAIGSSASSPSRRPVVRRSGRPSKTRALATIGEWVADLR